MLQVLVGALIAGVFGVAGVLYQSRREHEHWLRSARLDAYTEFQAALSSRWVTHLTRENLRLKGEQEIAFSQIPDVVAEVQKVNDKAERVALLGSPEVRRLAIALNRAAYALEAGSKEPQGLPDDFDNRKLMREFRVAARADLLPAPRRLPWRKPAKAITEGSA